MANNYCQFSASLDVGSQENVDKAMAIFADLRSESREDDEYWNVSVSPLRSSLCENTALWINSGEESGTPDDALAFVAKIGKALKLKGKWGLTWANTCSKLRLDEFDGGAAVIDLKTGRVEFINASTWLAKKLAGRGK